VPTKSTRARKLVLAKGQNSAALSGHEAVEQMDGIGDPAKRGEGLIIAPFCAGWRTYSITSSAPLTIEAENSIPRTLAALRLMKSSTFVTSCTGKSEGFSPLRIRPA
jgi:hypothetical protein